MENMMNSSKNNTIYCPSVLTGMSHEMRTHMNAIVAFSFLLKDSACNHEDREDFSTRILSACEQMIGLFDNFFDSAIIDSGASKADSQVYRLDNFLEELLPELKEDMKKEGNNDIQLVTELQYTNPVEVTIDKNKVYRIIRSLFLNSLKNTHSGYIKIGYILNNDKVNFYVLDSGYGYFKCKEFLHSDDLNKSLSMHNDTYTAINLTLAKKLIGMLDGGISVECNGLTGTGIYFSIPVRHISSGCIPIQKYISNIAI